MANGSIHVNVSSETAIAKSTVIATYSVLLVWSLFGNLLVIAVVLTYKRLKTNLNYLIVNMAVADLFVPLFNLTYAIYLIHHPNWTVGGEFGNALCRLSSLIFHMSPFVSSLSCIIIATERLVLIVYPMLKNTLFSGKRIFVLIAFTWIASTAFISPQFFLFRLQSQNGLLTCTVTDTEAYDPYAIFLVVVLFIVPLVSITIIYAIMLYNLLKASKNVSNIINNEQMLARQRRNKKILYMSIAIIVAFFVLCGPYYIILAIVAYLPKTTLQQMNKNEEIDIANFICQCLAFANAAVNPCIYFMFLGSYRDGARQIFRQKSDTTSNGEEQVEASRLRSISTTARKDNRDSIECNSSIVRKLEP